jgi:hypothetical protein
LDRIPPALQAVSLGGVGVILAQPDGAHLALYGVVFASLCSILTTAINLREDRKRADLQYTRDTERASKQFAEDKVAREFQADQVRLAFEAANAARTLAEAHIVAKVQESTDASTTAIDIGNHINDKLTRVTQAPGDAVKAGK